MMDEVFDQHRAHLHTVAYALLGSVHDAEDAVQETWMRWEAQHRATIQDPRAWLTTVVTRICLDEWGTARRRRETYVGPWLPEPEVRPQASAPRSLHTREPDQAAEVAHDVELALLVVLETLTPQERAAFVLCEVFRYSSAEVGSALGKTPEAVRQLVSRARRHVRDGAPSLATDKAQHASTVAAFARACEGRDIPALISTLAPDVVMVSDGGGNITASRKPVRGRTKVLTALTGWAALAARHGLRVEVATVLVNGKEGVLFREGQTLSLYDFDVVDGRIGTMHVVRNPDKLRDVYRDVAQHFPS
ncbi:RNA polymerase sigma factor SigJ [Demequina sp. B12]|uniref:RNA polymerase sigma factor SigJ n=1 Tax=Demequina sp. B12 TaxID=2992757 RepID=UPI00237B1D5D|nr:RNA polymerase sigma factor SigJ [Demequina sp. B12]MDE0572415.1 RNA polymerase sigma factor SigJ [Demequina sp. B12]